MVKVEIYFFLNRSLMFMQKITTLNKSVLLSAVLILVMGLSACAPLTAVLDATLPDTQSNSQVGAVDNNSNQSAQVSPDVSVNPVPVAAFEGTLRDIYKQVNPSVVNIQVVSSASTSLNLPNDLPLPDNHIPLPQQQALGSGFIWDKDGHIVTNNHVVEGATQIDVVFPDGTTYQAELVGSDADSDLAVIKIDAPASDLYPVSVANSDNVQVGDLAIAIGNPYGLDGTMTVGIISALGRSLSVENGMLTGTYSIPDIIQTDAAINPGNSGGVLLNDQGQVIGVTAAIESPVRANVGIGFVIPSAIVSNVVPELISNGKYDHSWLGLSGGTLIADIAEAMKLNRSQRGILVNSVVANGPSAEAGLLGSDQQFDYQGATIQIGGDVVTAINGTATPTFDDLVSYLASDTKPGQKVTLDIIRDGKKMSVDVTLGTRPTQNAAQPATSAFVTGQAYLGVSGGSLVSEIAKAMNLDENLKGVLVVEIASGSPAETAALQGSTKTMTLNGQEIKIGGDVITAVNDVAIDGINALRKELANYQAGDQVTLTIVRDGKVISVPVTLAERP
jgi:S1-C subfamily serine protease